MRPAARRDAGPTLQWADAATEKKIADAQAEIRRRREPTSGHASRPRATPTEGRRAAGRTLTRVRQFSARRSRARRVLPLRRHRAVSDDQLPTPLPQARLSPPPSARRARSRARATTGRWCRRRMRRRFARRPLRQPRGSRPAGCWWPSREDLVISPSAGGDGRRPSSRSRPAGRSAGRRSICDRRSPSRQGGGLLRAHPALSLDSG